MSTLINEIKSKQILAGEEAVIANLKAKGLIPKDNPQTHETFVIGFNENGDVIFFKSYEYLKRKDEAQSDLKWVIDNCHHWEIGAASEWKLTHEDICHDIIIPHP